MYRAKFNNNIFMGLNNIYSIQICLTNKFKSKKKIEHFIFVSTVYQINFQLRFV